MRRALLPLLLLTLAACSGPDRPRDQAAPVAATPTASPTAEPSTTPIVDTTPGWAVRRTDHADLDGDGIKEEIGYAGEYAPVRFVTTLSSTGRTLTPRFRLGAISWWPEGYPDLDGDGDREIVLSREFADQRPVVLDLQGDEFVWVTRRDRRPLVYGPTAATESGLAFANDWFVQRGRLVSYRSIQPFELGSHFFDVPSTTPCGAGRGRSTATA